MDEEKISRLRWGLYTSCLILSIFIPLAGGMVEKFGGGWAVSLTTLYVIWAILFGSFGLTFFERSSQFIIRCLYYLVCALFPLAFFGSLANNNDLHLWLPTSLIMGVFVGQAISDCCALITTHRLRRIVLRFLPAEETPLPLYNNYTPELDHSTGNLESDPPVTPVCVAVCEEFLVCGCDETQTSMTGSISTHTSAYDLNSIFEDTTTNVATVVLPNGSNYQPNCGRRGERISQHPHGFATRAGSNALEGPVDNPWAFE